MSFKHKNFNESFVMQSYVKKAIEKGIVNYDSESEIVKTAAKAVKETKLNYTLDDKILKLCNQLRNSGFESYADDLEKNFLSYKVASKDLYDVTKETGEDLVDAAHPEGSKKIIEKSTKDLGVVETIVDQKKKIEEAVKSEPTGKLALNLAAAIVKSANNSAEFKKLNALKNKVDFYKNNLLNYLDPKLNESEKHYAFNWVYKMSAYLNDRLASFGQISKNASDENLSNLKMEIDILESNLNNFKSDYLK